MPQLMLSFIMIAVHFVHLIEFSIVLLLQLLALETTIFKIMPEFLSFVF